MYVLTNTSVNTPHQKFQNGKETKITKEKRELTQLRDQEHHNDMKKQGKEEL